MKKIFIIMVIIGVIVILNRFPYGHSVSNPSVDENAKKPVAVEVFSTNQTKPVIEERSFLEWKGASTEEVLSGLGEPERRVPSRYGYEWWIFENKEGEYFQLGILNNTVVTGIWFNSNSEGALVPIGEDYQKIEEQYAFDSTLELKSEGSFSFELTEKDIKERPLIKLNDRWTAQLYFDTVTNKLSAVRMVRNDILLKLQPYRVEYRGDLPEPAILNNKEWQEIQEGMETQIFSITNFLRRQHGVRELSLHKEVSTVAFNHSKDMNEHNYFSHYSQNGDGLKERLEGINYLAAGENIAAQHVDAVAAVHGWLNSSGHRKTMFNQQYTHIGVGVHRRYYTQNFLLIQ